MPPEIIVTEGGTVIEVGADQANVVVESIDQPLVIEAPAEQGPMGPPGPDGPPGPIGLPGPGDPAIHTVQAGETLLGRRVVKIENNVATYATYTDLLLHGQLLGITTQAALSGENLDVLIHGFMDEPSWTWTPGLLWVGPTGTLVQTPPTPPGVIYSIARATSATRVYVHPSQPIEVN